MHTTNKVVLSSSDGSSANGTVLDTQLWVNASFQIYTGGVADSGTVKIQMSNDPVAAGYSPGATLPTPTHWSDIPNASSTVTAGVAAPITLTNISYRWMRAVYTRVGGSEAVTVQVMAMYP